LVSCFSVSCSAALRDLHSFPTRRSSDLSDSGQKGKVGLVYPGHTFSGVDVDRDRLGHTLLCQLLHELGVGLGQRQLEVVHQLVEDRKSTRLNSSHVKISYAVFCLKKKKD